MLTPKKTRESLAGKLLLSSALVAVSLAYGWWQRDNAAAPALAMVAMSPPLVPDRPLPAPDGSPMTASAPTAQTQAPPPDAPGPGSAPGKAAAASTPQASTPPAASLVPDVQSQQSETSPSSPASPTTQQALSMYLPTDEGSPPMPLVTGSPDAGAGTAAPAGAHLQDGDYVSDKHQLEWGDLRVKISVHGGLIAGVQILQYPDHRSQSLFLSEKAGPILESEVIKAQKAQVDAVSSATDTSYAFQDTVADAIIKATRE
jgi:uncharacterized protein with FMN-binding domain